VSLSIRTTYEFRRVRLALVGEVDYLTTPALRQAISDVLNAGPIAHLVLDLRGLTLIDSTGIGTLVIARRICTELGTKLHIRSANPFISRVLHGVGVGELLDPEPTIEIKPRLPRRQHRVPAAGTAAPARAAGD
jgi:anti-sigma B factor antagonist